MVYNNSIKLTFSIFFSHWDKSDKYTCTLWSKGQLFQEWSSLFIGLWPTSKGLCIFHVYSMLIGRFFVLTLFYCSKFPLCFWRASKFTLSQTFRATGSSEHIHFHILWHLMSWEEFLTDTEQNSTADSSSHQACSMQSLVRKYIDVLIDH